MSEENAPAGHPMDEIAQRFNMHTGPISEDQPDSGAAPPSASSTPAGPDASGHRPSLKTGSAFGPISFSSDQIGEPAFFVDRELCLRWIAPGGADAFSRALARERESGSTANVFSLLIKPAIRDALCDWQTFFSFVYVLLRRLTPRDTFDSGTVFLSGEHTAHMDIRSSDTEAVHPFQIDSCMLMGNEAGTEPPLRIFGIASGEGTLFLIRKDLWHPMATGDRKPDAIAGTVESTDEKKAICILSARLNASHRIAESMLPDVFFKLMNRIGEEADGAAKSLGGVRAGGQGAELLYMFTKNAGRNPIFSAICCATRLNDRMQSLQEKSKPEMGWAYEICMNVGISHGTDDLSAPEPAGSMELMIPGGASDQSSLLSAVAAKGEIWITKDAVGQLPKSLIDQMVMGVDRQGQFFQNFFTRLSDLSSKAGISQSKQDDMGGLPVTRIVKIETPK